MGGRQNVERPTPNVEWGTGGAGEMGRGWNPDLAVAEQASSSPRGGGSPNAERPLGDGCAGEMEKGEVNYSSWLFGCLR